jgi:hypothetical protein
MKTYTKEFPSISAFGRAVAASARVDGADNASQSDAFSDTPHTMGEAITIAEAGGFWAEGARNLPAVNVASDFGHMADIRQRAPMRAVVGFLPHVPSVVQNLPLHMITCAPQNRAKRYVRIGVAIGRAANVSQSSAYNRGRAIMGLVESLQLRGYGVEVVACWRNEESKTRIHLDVIVKPSDGQWSPEIAAFALAATSFQRRLAWRYVEGWHGAHVITQNTYGSASSRQSDGFDIFFPRVNENAPWATPERAIQSALSESADWSKAQ